jgi:hypothetical protein
MLHRVDPIRIDVSEERRFLQDPHYLKSQKTAFFGPYLYSVLPKNAIKSEPFIVGISITFRTGYSLCSCHSHDLHYHIHDVSS